MITTFCLFCQIPNVSKPVASATSIQQKVQPIDVVHLKERIREKRSCWNVRSWWHQTQVHGHCFLKLRPYYEFIRFDPDMTYSFFFTLNSIRNSAFDIDKKLSWKILCARAEIKRAYASLSDFRIKNVLLIGHLSTTHWLSSSFAF